MNRGARGDSLLMLSLQRLSNRKPPLLSESESGGSMSRWPFSFLMDCVVIKPRPWTALNLLFASEERPASVQTMNSSVPKSLRIFCSSGLREIC